MSLTTPVPRDADAVFPGENWFLYWKTSSSLWRNKLEEFPGTGKIIVPINWSFHSETGDRYDFAEVRPETDLKKLVTIAEELGKEIVFFLPLTPMPFLPNGGIPHLLARSQSLNHEKMAYGIIDGDEDINKLYSFYDPRVFQGFVRFVNTLGAYISQQGITADIYGIDCGYFKGQQFVSYMHDTSNTFDQGFSRFLGTKAEDLGNENTDISSLIQSPEDELKLKNQFAQTLKELYFTAAEQGISANWEGTLRVSFLGGGQEDFFNRLCGNDSLATYSAGIFQAICKDVIPSSILLPSRRKSGILGRELKELVSTSYLQAKLEHDYYEEQSVTSFMPLSFFEVFENTDSGESSARWQELGLWSYLDEHFNWCYKNKEMNDFKWDESSDVTNVVSFVHGREIDQKKFNTILKTFMNGGKIVFNISGLSEILKRKLEAFYLENSLEVEKVNFHTSIQNVILGEGRLLIFEGDNLESLSNDKLFTFWSKLVSTFHLYHLELTKVEGIDYSWRTRTSSLNELNYEEVRRLSVYNPTSYKKKVKVNVKKNFVLMKVLDEINVSVNSHPHEIEIEILPEGSLSLDFGVFT